MDTNLFQVRFLGGPFDGRHGEVAARTFGCPMYIYVLDDGGVVSPDLIGARSLEACALARRANLYARDIVQPRDGEPYRVRFMHGPTE